MIFGGDKELRENSELQGMEILLKKKKWAWGLGLVTREGRERKNHLSGKKQQLGTVEIHSPWHTPLPSSPKI